MRIKGKVTKINNSETHPKDSFLEIELFNYKGGTFIGFYIPIKEGKKIGIGDKVEIKIGIV